MRIPGIIYCFFLLFPVQSLLPQNAPVSTIETVVSFEQTAEIGISVSGFSNIGSSSLTILYDASVLQAISVSLGPQVPGMLSTDLNVPGAVSVGWYWYPAVNLPDNAVFLRITFSRVRIGRSIVSFNVENATLCSWWDGNFNLLNDVPSSDYYISGAVLLLHADTQFNVNQTDNQAGVNPAFLLDLPSGLNNMPQAFASKQKNNLLIEQSKNSFYNPELIFGTQQTQIYYCLPEKSYGMIEVFNVDGKLSDIIHIPMKEPGTYFENVNLINAGIYISRIYISNGFVSQTKVIKFYANP